MSSFMLKPSLYLSCALVLTCELGVRAEEITLERTLSLIQTASPEQMEVKVAEARVHLLESLSKRRIDLRPQLGILTLTNPVAMAASIGSGLLVNRNVAPSPFTLLNARVDLLSAELQDARSAFIRRLQASRTFFDLLDTQRAEKHECEERDAHDRERLIVEKLVARGRLTMIDQLRYEQEHMQLLSDCLESKVRRKLASAALAMAVGMPRVDLAARLTDAATDLIDGSRTDANDTALAAGEAQVEALRRKAAQIRQAAASGGRVRLPDISVFQSHTTEAASNNNLSPNFLSGANYLYPTVSWRIPLRNTGEHNAEVEMLNAKVQKLGVEMDLFEQMIRSELQTLRALNANSPERIAIEEQKLSIAERSAKMVALRYEKGLAVITDVLQARQQERRLRVSALRLRQEAAGRRLLALAAAGSVVETPAVQARVQNSEWQDPGERSASLPSPAMHTPLTTVSVPWAGTQTNLKSTANASAVNVKAQTIHSGSGPRGSRTRSSTGPATGDVRPGKPESLVCGIVNGRVANCVASSNQNGRRL